MPENVYFPYHREVRMTNAKLTPMIYTLALGAALLASGCNSSGGTDPAATHPHGTGIANCDALLTGAEAAVILGGTIVSTTPRDTGAILTCTYKAALEAGGILPPQIIITAFTTDGFAASKHTTVPAYYDFLDTTTAASLKTPLTGIGTKAMYMLGPRKLAMYKGDVYADVICRPHGIPVIDTSAAAFEGAKAIAIKVAAK